MTDADKCKHRLCCSECRALTLDLCNEVRQLRERAEAWRTATLTKLGKCETCDGDGFMGALGVRPPDYREVIEDEPCAECGGTGRGDIAKAIDMECAKARRDGIKAACEWLVQHGGPFSADEMGEDLL